MNINVSQSLQLKQTLRLSQIMVQRFNVLQQTVTEFEESLQTLGKKNPFLSFNDLNQKAPSGFLNNTSVSPIDFATYSESFMAVLVNQLDAQFLSEVDYEIILMLIDDLDESGFVSNYKAIREKIMGQFNVTKEQVFQCLKILQSFEPEGVGARSINECLHIQIDQYDLDNDIDKNNLKAIVKTYLMELSEKNYDPILTNLELSQDQLNHYIEFIGGLNPTPKAQFASNDTIQIQPSLRIKVDNGIISIKNLEEERFQLRLNDDMIAQISEDSTPEMKKQFNEAKVWIEHFKKRQNLIQSCGEYLVQKQRLYFFEGPDFLLPCLQRDMAKALGVSDSTISRIVRSKYIECDHGTILIKQLCRRNIYGKTQAQVRHLVGYYCQKYPTLSDNKISELLKSIGLPIARRTVTKYRHEANLKSSGQRHETT